MTERSCGGCTMCCKVFYIHDLDPPKKMNTWCTHCDVGVGCKIYEKRPPSCRDFKCMWLEDTLGFFEEEMRPDKSKVVLQATFQSGVLVHCDPNNPWAWRKQPLLGKLHILAKGGYPVSIEAGGRHWIMGTLGVWEADPKSKKMNEHGYTYVEVPEAVAKKIGYWIRPDLPMPHAHPQIAK